MTKHALPLKDSVVEPSGFDEPTEDEQPPPLESDSEIATHETDGDQPGTKTRAGGTSRISWLRLFAFGLLPALAMLLAMGCGVLKWRDASVRDAQIAQIEATQAAKDGTVALLSYRPDTVEKDLGAARDRLTGDFKDAYTSLTNDVVIPGAKQKQISAVASVPAVAPISAAGNEAVVLVFTNQSVIVGTSAPTDTASSVKVTLDRVDGRWLISKFEPI